MKIHFNINSHNRFENLAYLVKSIQTEANKNKHLFDDFSIRIYDDGSKDQDIAKPSFQNDDVEFVSLQHHGKKKYWMIWNRIIRKLPDADLYVFLPDDVELKENFFSLLNTIHHAIPKNAGSVNILNEKHRCLVPSWSSKQPQIEYHDGNRYLKTGWFDLCGIITKPAIEYLKKQPIQINPSRWNNNPKLSSGVGEFISKTLRRKFELYGSPVSLVEHVGHVSKMNPDERKNNPLKSWDLPYIFAGMATIKGREGVAQVASKSLLPYVDRLYIVFNNMQIPGWAKNDPKIHPVSGNNAKGDGAKFHMLDLMKDPNTFGFDDFYFFSVDDDLIYPPDYVSKNIREIELHDRGAIICTHGKVMPEKIKKFYGAHLLMYHTTSQLNESAPVNLPGTGTVAFHCKAIKFGTDNIHKPNMADIWMGIEAQKQKVPIYAIARPKNWIKILPVKNTIYDQHKNDDSEQTESFNSIKWKLNK